MAWTYFLTSMTVTVLHKLTGKLQGHQAVALTG